MSEDKNYGCPTCGCRIYNEIGPCKGETEIKQAEKRGAERMFKICAGSMPGCAGSPWEPIEADIWAEWEKKGNE